MYKAGNILNLVSSNLPNIRARVAKDLKFGLNYWPILFNVRISRDKPPAGRLVIQKNNLVRFA